MINDRKYAQTGHPKFYWTLEVLSQTKKKDFLIMDSLMFSIFSVVCWMVGWCLSRICVSYMIDKIVFLQNY